MKKLIAIAVLFVSVTAAVLAQDDEGKWKVGFTARFVTDMFYATGTKYKQVITPAGGPSKTEEFGNYAKGTVNFFGNSTYLPHQDNRLLLSLSNSGENYDLYADIKLDDWAQKWNGIGDYLINNASADWGATGTAGMFTGWIGNKWQPETFTSTYGTWNDWLGWNQLSRFGVWRVPGSPGTLPYANNADDNFVTTNGFRTWQQWGAVAALGATFADNYRFAVGYRLDPGYANWNPNGGSAYDSASSINASFMFSARPVDGITFDLLYYVLGHDDDTIERPKGTPNNYEPPRAHWKNTIGAYVGINLIENLGISLGYAVNFNAYETGGWLENFNVTNRDVTYKAPIYSGIDLHLSYNGIDKVGLTFNNNFSFASVKGERKPGDYDAITGTVLNTVYFDSLVYGFDEKTTVGEGWTHDWFHWNTELSASLGFIDGVGLTVALGDQLGVVTRTYVRPDHVAKSWDGTEKILDVGLENELRVSVFADHSVGAVTVGAGLFFGVKSYLGNTDTTLVDSTGVNKVVTTRDTVVFGVPILFKVAF